MAAKDPIVRPPDGLAAPATHVEAVVTSDVADTGDLAFVSRAIYVGVAGDVTAVLRDDTQATFKNVPAGVFMPIRAKRILTTGTTATNLLSLS